jgi:hypothetical protein
VAKKRKPVEAIDLNHLPRRVVPEMISAQCPNCARRYSKKAALRGQQVACPTCGWVIILL